MWWWEGDGAAADAHARPASHLPIATEHRLSAQEPLQRRLRAALPSARMRSKQASMKPASRRVPSSVATTARRSSVVSDTRMGWLLRQAPPPRVAWYSSSAGRGAAAAGSAALLRRSARR